MVVSKKEAKILNIMRIIIILALIIASVTIGFWLYDNQPKDKVEVNKEILSSQDIQEYTRWRSCMNNSDSTNTDCQECDQLFNKKGIFEY